MIGFCKSYEILKRLYLEMRSH